MDKPLTGLSQHSSLCRRLQCGHALSRPVTCAQPPLARHACLRRQHLQRVEAAEGLLLCAARQCGCWGRARRRRWPVQVQSLAGAGCLACVNLCPSCSPPQTTVTEPVWRTPYDFTLALVACVGASYRASSWGAGHQRGHQGRLWCGGASACGGATADAL